MAPVVRLAWQIGLTSLVALVILGSGLGHGIARPIHELATIVDQLASGRLDAEIPESDRGDEIGRVARAMVAFKQSLIRNRDLEEQRQRFTTELERLAPYDPLTGLGIEPCCGARSTGCRRPPTARRRPPSSCSIWTGSRRSTTP